MSGNNRSVFIIFLTVVCSCMSLSIIQNPRNDSDLLGLKSFKGSSISKNGVDLCFSVKTDVSGYLQFHLVMDGIVGRLPTFQKENQRNDYCVRPINNTVCIIKNGRAIREIGSPVPKRIFVVFTSSGRGDTLWTVFNLRDGRGKHLEMGEEYEFSLEEFSKDFQSFQSGSFFVNEDNVRFFSNSSIAGTLDFHIVTDKIPIHFSVAEEGNQWNLYNVLFINGTIWVTKNGNIIKQITSFAPERIYVKFPSNDNTSWMVFNVCEDGESRSCDIQCPACKNMKTPRNIPKKM
jgi:hypothetical protein